MIGDPFRFYRVAPPVPTYGPVELPMVDVQSSFPSDFVANRVRQGGSSFKRPIVGLMGQPQRDMVEMITGVEQTPSEAMGISNPVGAFLTDAVLDPLNIGVTSIGAAMMRNSMRNPFKAFNLRNAYRLNPWAFKPNPEAYYHRSPNLENIINQEKRTLQGFGQSEAGKAFSETKDYYPGTKLNLRKPANSSLYFSKGVPLDYGRYNPETFNEVGRRIMTGQGYPGPYMVEVKGVPMGASTKGRLPGADPKGLETYAVSRRPISLDEAKFYKEDWLRGYRQIK